MPDIRVWLCGHCGKGPMAVDVDRFCRYCAVQRDGYATSNTPDHLPSPETSTQSGESVSSPLSLPKPPQASSTTVSKNIFWKFTLRDTVAFVFQLIALIIGLIFGAWAIKSYDAALTANEQALIQNKMALLGICYGGDLGLGSPDSAVCNGLKQALPLASMASSLAIPFVPVTIATTVPAQSTVTGTVSLSPTTSSVPIEPSPAPIPTASSVPIEPSSAPIPTTSSVPIEPSSAPIPTTSSVPIEPSSAPVPTSISSPYKADHPLSLGTIIGIIVGSVIGLALIVVAPLSYYMRDRGQRISNRAWDASNRENEKCKPYHFHPVNSESPEGSHLHRQRSAVLP